MDYKAKLADLEEEMRGNLNAVHATQAKIDRVRFLIANSADLTRAAREAKEAEVA